MYQLEVKQMKDFKLYLGTIAFLSLLTASTWVLVKLEEKRCLEKILAGENFDYWDWAKADFVSKLCLEKGLTRYPACKKAKEVKQAYLDHKLRIKKYGF